MASAVALLSLALCGTAVAQQDGVPASTSERQELGVFGRYTREATHPRESDFYREDAKVRHEPAFVEPMTTRPPAGRVKKIGLSGWTAPPGRGALPQVLQQEFSGWFGIGISAVWE